MDESLDLHYGRLRTAPRTFALTHQEIQLFDELKEFVNSCSEMSKIELRVAGGWVRDKLLAKQCQDIDIALNEITGENFLQHFNTWHRANGRPQSHIHVIPKNPEKSKHLETARTKYENFSLDFVNLRTETYTNDSRIPSQVNFGTPLEDALRRDFTINALFYHIQRDFVEDWTGQGFFDLEQKIIRTPLNAIITLRDDGLRLLRGIRFSTTLQFKCDEAFLQAAHDEIVLERFKNNVQGREFEKMLLSSSPDQCLDLICSQCHIHDILFDLPSLNTEPWCTARGILLVNHLCHSTRLCQDSPPDILFDSPQGKCCFILSAHQRKDLALAAFFSPYSGISFSSPLKIKCCKKSFPLVTRILSQTLKLQKKTVSRVCQILRGATYWCKTFDSWNTQPTCVPDLNDPLITLEHDFASNIQVFTRVLARHLGQEIWILSLMLAYIIQDALSPNSVLNAMRNIYNLTQSYGNAKLFQAPIFDGNQLKILFPNRSSKTDIKHMLNYQIQLHFSNETISKQDLEASLLKTFNHLTRPRPC